MNNKNTCSLQIYSLLIYQHSLKRKEVDLQANSFIFDFIPKTSNHRYLITENCTFSGKFLAFFSTQIRRIKISRQDTYGIFSFRYFCDPQGMHNQKMRVPNPGIFMPELSIAQLVGIYYISLLYFVFWVLSFGFCLLFPL